MRHWFGVHWGAPACNELPHTETPVDVPCFYCQEPIGVDDYGFLTPVFRSEGATIEPIHRECDFRSVIGSVGHLLRLCSCFGGSMSDPPGLTRRQAAIAACLLFEEKRGYAIGLVAPNSITCFTCGRTSSNQGDVEARYCAECRVFHDFRDEARGQGIPDGVWRRRQ